MQGKQKGINGFQKKTWGNTKEMFNKYKGNAKDLNGPQVSSSEEEEEEEVH